MDENINYANIPENDEYQKPEEYKQWIAVILELIRKLKGTTNYFDDIKLSITGIIGDNETDNIYNLSQIYDKIQELIKKDNDQQIDIDALKQLTNSLQELVTQHSAKISTLETKVTNLESLTSELQTLLTQLTEKVNTNTEDIESIKQQIESILAEIEKLNNLTSENYFARQVIKNRNFPQHVKYIRIYMKGYRSPTDGTRINKNRIIQISAVTCNGVNKAKPTSTNIVKLSTNAPSSECSGFGNDDEIPKCLDENLEVGAGSVNFTQFGQSDGDYYLQVELNSVVKTLEYIQIWFYTENLVQLPYYDNIKVDVASTLTDPTKDGSNWYTLFDNSNRSPIYAHQYGLRLYLNETHYKSETDIKNLQTWKQDWVDGEYERSLKIGNRKVYIQSTDPSSAVDGDIWIKYTT